MAVPDDGLNKETYWKFFDMAFICTFAVINYTQGHLGLLGHLNNIYIYAWRFKIYGEASEI